MPSLPNIPSKTENMSKSSNHSSSLPFANKSSILFTSLIYLSNSRFLSASIHFFSYSLLSVSGFLLAGVFCWLCPILLSNQCDREKFRSIYVLSFWLILTVGVISSNRSLWQSLHVLIYKWVKEIPCLILVC